MAHKLCPLSFFAFYVNKDAAQAGGAHHCIEDSCAWWDGNLEQCSAKSAFDAMGMVADAYSSGEMPAPASKPKVVSSVLDKLREKRKVLPTVTPTAVTPASTPPPPPPPPAPLSAPTSPTSPTEPSNIQQVIETKAQVEKPEPSVDDLLNPPKIPISQLPIVSVKPAEEEGGK